MSSEPRPIAPPAPGDLDGALARLGYATFRPGQRESIETLLTAGRLLLVAPTGGGKSLTYQLPATLLSGTTLVISPLIALMNDQVQALEARGVAATFLSATLEGDEVRRRMGRIADGSYRPLSRPLYLYVAEASLARPEVREFVRFYAALAAEAVAAVGYVPLAGGAYAANQAAVEAATTATPVP